MDNRTLTDDDVKAIVDTLIEQFYNTIGKGFMRIVWGGIMAILMLIAIYGMKK